MKIDVGIDMTNLNILYFKPKPTKRKILHKEKIKIIDCIYKYIKSDQFKTGRYYLIPTVVPCLNFTFIVDRKYNIFMTDGNEDRYIANINDTV